MTEPNFLPECNGFPQVSVVIPSARLGMRRASVCVINQDGTMEHETTPYMYVNSPDMMVRLLEGCTDTFEQHHKVAKLQHANDVAMLRKATQRADELITEALMAYGFTYLPENFDERDCNLFDALVLASHNASNAKV